MNLRTLALVILITLCGTVVKAEWKVDERCNNITRRTLQQRVQDESPLHEAEWQKEQEESSVALQPPNSSLRGNRRRLQNQKFIFRMRMFWQEGYCWQEEWIERFWCMSCEGGTCNVGDSLWIQECSDTDIQLFTFEPVAGTGGGKLKPFTYQDLCWEHTNSTEMELHYTLQPCDDSNYNTQIITGWQVTGHFELYPFGESTGKCITQGHHPKPKEVIVAQPCGNPRWDHTNYWTVYEPTYATSPTTVPLAPWEICHPGRLLYKNNITATGDLFYNKEFDAILQQESDGNLVVKQGGVIIWESNVNEGFGDYFSKLQGDGNLVTYKGKPPNGDSIVWRSKRAGPTTFDYFLGLDCDKQAVSVYENIPTDPGRIIWTSGVMPTPAPTPSPPLMLASNKTSQFQTVPFNMSALEFTGYKEYDYEHHGNCGVGPVDANLASDAVCHEQGSQCAISFTMPGEWLVYTFEAATDVTVDVTLRIASLNVTKRIFFEIDGIPGYGQANGPGKSWTTYEDVLVWRGAPLQAGINRMKITFEDGNINLCSISVSPSGYPQSGIVVWETAEDYLQEEDTASPSAASTLEEESVPPSVAPTIESTWKLSAGPPAELSLIPTLMPSLDSTPPPSYGSWTPLPSLGPTSEPSPLPTAYPTSEPMATISFSQSELKTIPFDISAIHYSDYREHSDEDHGDCDAGPVDAEYVNDTICHDRGSACSVGWREPGDMLEYTFETATDANVDVVLRVADAASKKLAVVLPGISGYALVTGPGRGWYDFEDIVAWKNLSLSAGVHTLRVYFISGEMNLCSISVWHTLSPI